MLLDHRRKYNVVLMKSFLFSFSVFSSRSRGPNAFSIKLKSEPENLKCEQNEI